jgi:hypothetical protein
MVDRNELKTVAFGYRARALVILGTVFFRKRVRRPLAIRDTRRSLTAGDGLAQASCRRGFRSAFSDYLFMLKPGTLP